MKLKAIGIKFALGLFLLFLFVYIFSTFSSVLSNNKYSVDSFKFSQFGYEESLLVIYDDEVTFLHNEDIYTGIVEFRDGVIYLNSDECVFVIIDESTLYYSKTFIYLDRIGG